MKRLSIVILALACSFTSPSWGYRVLGEMESSYELELGEVGLPRATMGTVHFRPCEDCRSTSLQVNSSTRYFVNGVQYDFREFLALVEEIKDTAGGNQNSMVDLFYDKSTELVSRLMVTEFPNYSD